MIERTRKILSAIAVLVVWGLLGSCSSSRQQSISKSLDPGKWVGTWATAPQLVEPNNMPPQPGLTNNTIRQVVRVSIGGEKLRLQFSNAFSKQPVTMKSDALAVAKTVRYI